MNALRNKNKRFVFFYFNHIQPDRIRQVVPAHVEYWHTANVEGYAGGPFADRSGGLITFEAARLEEATAIIENDPFVQNELIAEKWIKEWVPE
jgi:uncharacterized protein YciI